MEEFEDFREEKPGEDELPLFTWGEDDLDRFMFAIFENMDPVKRKEVESELMDTYWPGTKFLTDSELLKRKYFNSEHTFQFVIALKRYMAETGKGWIEELENGWSFGNAGGL